MKRLVLSILVLLSLIISGCSQNNFNSMKEAEYDSMEYMTTAKIDSIKRPEKSAKEILDDLANQEYSFDKTQISDDDYEIIENFGKDFINLYSGAASEQEKISFGNFISNENLLRFTYKILELEQKNEFRGSLFVNFGLENNFSEVEIKSLDENLCYLKIPYEFQGTGMLCQLLVQSENRSLKIVDLYFGRKDGVDTIVTGHLAVRKIGNPELWNDNEWVTGVFEKIENYESEIVY